MCNKLVQTTDGNLFIYSI